MFELETLTNEDVNIFKFDESYKETRQINHKEVFRKVMACYPTLSNFDVDLDLTAGYKSNSAFVNDQDRFYAGLVFKMPLYSTAENSRVREQEYNRRKDVSKLIADFTHQITKRDLSIRLIALYKNLEKREQLRVRAGIEHKKGSLVTVSDQVSYLEKIAKEYQKKHEAVSEIESIKLQLVAHCESKKAPKIDKYLTQIINEMD